MSRRWRLAIHHPAFAVGLVLTLAIVGTAICSLVYTPRDPLRMELASRLQAPSAAHLMGTDQYGRDLLSRVMRGAIASLAVGAVAVGIGLGVGVILGAAGGWVGGWIDEAVMRLTDAVYGFPAVLSALLVTAVFGPGVLISMVAVGIAYVPVFARLSRASVLALRAQEFVTAARALGARDGAILRRHILPNAVSPLIVQATISFPLAILAEAALSYLGLGTQPPNPSWGLMLREAQNFLQLSPWYAVFPGAAIALAVLGFNLLGDGLRDLLDPRVSQ
ncbi:MAG TPA: ABC transporter permease [Methylomirabilota bacterium]|jgi:peptide/nickel transport system permease protein|nr:ABC transporter permease [Methylomirabilota bacterium]